MRECLAGTQKTSCDCLKNTHQENQTKTNTHQENSTISRLCSSFAPHIQNACCESSVIHRCYIIVQLLQTIADPQKFTNIACHYCLVRVACMMRFQHTVREIMITFLSYISLSLDIYISIACHSFSGLAVRLQHTVIVRYPTTWQCRPGGACRGICDLSLHLLRSADQASVY